MALGAGLAASSLLALAAIAATLLARRRLVAASNEIARLAAELAHTRGLLDASPDLYLCRDSATGEEAASPALAAFIGSQSSLCGLSDVLAILAPDDARSLERAMAALEADGAPFDLALRAADGARALRAAGVRARPSRGVVSLLWLRDATADAENEARGEAERGGLRRLLDVIPLPAWRRDATLGPSYVNSAYQGAVASEPAAPDAVPEIAVGVSGEDGRALARRARDSGAPAIETRHVVIAGERRLAEIAEFPDPETGGTTGYLLDRTALESAQAELARHIEGHDEVLHNLGTAIAIYGPDQRLTFFNNAFLRVWQLDEAWLRSKPQIGEVLEAMHERRKLPEFADFPAFKRDMQRLFTSLIEPLEELVHLPDEATFRMVVTPHPFGGLLYTWEDVTDALALERNYNTLIAVQRETLDNLYEGVAVIGGDGRLKLSNPAFGRMWQVPPDALAASPHVGALVERMRGLFADGDWAERKDELIDLFTDREARTGRLERADGAVLDYASVPLPDGDVLAIHLDVSDSIQVERALRERNEALETADRLKSEFIANVSYELRTPLNTIIGFAEILTEQYFGTLNARQIEYSRGILESSQRLLALINDILDLASIESGHMALELEQIDLYGMLGSVLALTRERARTKKLDIEFDCPADIGVIVADERRIKQALFHILSNAIKFTSEGGSIALKGRRADGQVELTFADTGVGIPKEDHGRVFGKFERGHHPEARHGAGLGLSLVKSFIELHGGTVELESEQGVGTRITCRLPAREPAEAAGPIAHRA